ncbi:hypothetical protein BFJ63_vAg17460 [Fusarium oxysporum f. sp. narcissi]|uniref:Uncharacterized protein n=1 Tax=Fusarium oxysporum f. sp. narcissi TaxID=451672 RepID=A0A4V1RXX8_FUSOX|nr:hypothetical protein BFJ63_vAg17460 [Fusarium oxysporum f. sp. narcissi]
MLTVVFRDEKSADTILKQLPTMMRIALRHILVNSWCGEETRIFVEYPETGQKDRMSCWKQRVQLYRGIQKGVSELEIEYNKNLAKSSGTLPDLHDLSFAGYIRCWMDIWAKVQRQGHKAFVDYFDPWRALAANMFQMTQLPREEIKFLSPIVKEYSTRLTLHCRELESSMERMNQGAKHMEETTRMQKQSIEKLREEIRALKGEIHNSVAAFELLLARFGAGIDSKTPLAITRQERIAVFLKASEEEKKRGEDKATGRVEVHKSLANMQGMVVRVEKMFEDYKLQIQNQQDYLNTTLASLSSTEGNVEQLRRKSADDDKRIRTLENELKLREEDFTKVTKSLLERQKIIFDMEDGKEGLVSNRRSQKPSEEKYTFPVDSEKNIQEGRSCYCTQKEKTGEDNNENKLGPQTLADSKKEIRELKEEMAGKDVLIQKLISGLYGLRQSYKQKNLEHGSIRTERDTLLSRLYEVQEAVERQSEKPVIFEGKHSELVGWIENQARRSRAAEEDLKTLQYQQDNLREEHKQTVQEKDRQIQDLRKEMVDRLKVQEESDKLKSILCQLKEVVSPHAEGEISFENEYIHLISWVNKQIEQYRGARENLNIRQAHHNAQSMASIKPSKLETATKNTKDFKQQVQEPPEVITEDSQATQMWLKNDATNMEKSRAPAATRDKGNVTNCIYSNNLPDSYNSVITPTDQIDRILGFFFERYNREIESTQNKHELLQKKLGNMDGRLDIYIDVLTSTPVCFLADFLSFTMTQGDKNAEGGITDKLDLLIKRMSERFREIWIGTSQREEETIQGTENIQTVSIMSDRKTGKTSPPQLFQLTNCQSNTQSKSAKSLISPEKHATKSVCTQTIEIASVQVAKTDQRNPTNCKIPDEPGLTKGAVAPKGRILRSAANGKKKTSCNNGLESGIGIFHVKLDPERIKKARSRSPAR